jgi:hypothetical protein
MPVRCECQITYVIQPRIHSTFAIQDGFSRRLEVSVRVILEHATDVATQPPISHVFVLQCRITHIIEGWSYKG